MIDRMPKFEMPKIDIPDMPNIDMGEMASPKFNVDTSPAFQPPDFTSPNMDFSMSMPGGGGPLNEPMPEGKEEIPFDQRKANVEQELEQCKESQETCEKAE